MSPLKSPIEYGLDSKFADYLPHQAEAILSVQDQFRSGKSTVLLSAPTGSGKSLLAIVLAKRLSEQYSFDFSSLISVQTKALQKQYVDDFSHIVSMVGRGNFQCAEQPDLSVDEGLCSLPDYKCEDKWTVCGYYQQKALAAKSSTVVTNVCLSGDSRVPVLLPDGKISYFSIKALVENPRPDIKVFAFNPKSWCVEAVNIQQYWEHPPAELFEISLHSGRTLCATDGHNLWRCASDGTPEAIALKGLTIGDKVAIPIALPSVEQVPDDNVHLDVLAILADNEALSERLFIRGPAAVELCKRFKEEIRKMLKEEIRLGTRSNRPTQSLCYFKQHASLPWRLARNLPVAQEDLPDIEVSLGHGSVPFPGSLEISESFCWLAGHWIADGSSSARSISFAVNETLEEEFCTHIASVFPTVNYHRFKNERKCAVYNFSSIVLRKLWHEIGLTGLARTKRVPPIIRESPMPMIRAFVRGYLEGDGNHLGPNDKPRKGDLSFVGCSSKSEGLIDDLLELLLILGHPARKSYSTQNGLFTLYFHSRDESYGWYAREALNEIWWDKVECIENTGRTEPVYDLGTEHHNFIANRTFVHNSFLLHEINYTDGMVCGNRNFMVLDEGHLLENAIMGFVSVLLPEKSLRAVGVNLPSLKDPEDARKWASQIFPIVAKEYTALSARVSSATRSDGSVDVYDIRQLLRYKAMTKRLSTLQNIEPGKWFLAQTYVGYTLKPFLVDEFVQPLVTSHSPRVLMMSATFLSSRVMTKLLGLDARTTGWHEMDSNFPKERRPYNFIPVLKLNYKTGSIGYSRLTAAIDEILEKHPGEKGVVHTSSFKIMNQILKFTKHPQRFLSHKPSSSQERGLTRDEAIAEYMRTSEPRVLISPSVGLGLDLYDNLCRFQVLAKVPWASLADPQVKYRLEHDSVWYAWNAIAGIVQSCGRSTRHVKDYSTCYLLDAALWQLLKKQKGLFPKWWRDALHIVKSVDEAVIAKH